MRTIAKHLSVTLLALACGGYGGATWAQQSSTMPGQEQAGQAKQQLEKAGQQAGETMRQAPGRAEQALRGEQPTTRLGVNLPPGVTPKRASGAEGIRDVFKTTVNAVITGDFNKLKSQLTSADQKRLGGNFEDQADSQLKSTVDQLRNTWHQKFNTDFDISKEDQVFAQPYAYISQGEISDPNQLAAHWPLEPTMSAMGGMQQQPTPQSAGGPQNLSERELDRGRDLAVVVLPAQGNQPELTISLLHQAPNNWKIDIPDNVDANALITSLNQHLSQAEQMSSQWPSDRQAADRDIARSVFAALYNVPARGDQAQQQPSATQPGQQQPGQSQQPSSMGGQTDQTGQ